MADIVKKKTWWKQKTTWTGLLFMSTLLLPKLGLDEMTISGIRYILIGLAAIFARQAIEGLKSPDSPAEYSTSGILNKVKGILSFWRWFKKERGER